MGITDLLRHPGSQRPVARRASIVGLELESAAVTVPAGAEVEIDVVMEALADGTITLSGTVRAPWVGECRRCLRDVEGVVGADVREVFARDSIEGETYPIAGDEIDLEPVARDAILLALPLAPLCADDCAGPAPEVFPVVAEADADGTDVPPRDPRWSALDALRLDDDDP